MTPDDEVRAQELRAAIALIDKAINHLAGLAAHMETEAGAETYERAIAALTWEAWHLTRLIPVEPGPLDKPSNLAAFARQKASA